MKIHSGLESDMSSAKSTDKPQQWSEVKGTVDFRCQLGQGSSWYKWYTPPNCDPLDHARYLAALHCGVALPGY